VGHFSSQTHTEMATDTKTPPPTPLKRPEFFEPSPPKAKVPVSRRLLAHIQPKVLSFDEIDVAPKKGISKQSLIKLHQLDQSLFASNAH